MLVIWFRTGFFFITYISSKTNIDSSIALADLQHHCKLIVQTQETPAFLCYVIVLLKHKPLISYRFRSRISIAFFWRNVWKNYCVNKPQVITNNCFNHKIAVYGIFTKIETVNAFSLRFKFTLN